uniref:Uncharacterized protein n=1 Tax=Arundo donax TaxID=35708 RepID=A0A0A8ZAI2_ARUDO
MISSLNPFFQFLRLGCLPSKRSLPLSPYLPRCHYE